MKFSSSWSDEHRLALSVVAASSAVLLMFGFYSISKRITKPFEPTTPGQYKTVEEQQAEAINALKFRDTDGDGITDYDELYIYHTSPYLVDTDGDGIPDGVEIKNGTDPNCPEGKTCQNSAVAAPSTKIDPNNLIDTSQFIDFAALQGSMQATSTVVAPDASVFQKFDAVKVRSLLKSAGMSEAQLSQISDVQLQQVYEQALKDQIATSTLDSLDARQAAMQAAASGTTK